MSEKENKVSQRDKKYWLKPGVEVAHRDHPERKMIVDDILKKTEQIVLESGKKEPRTFTVGIECHWFTDDGGYARGRFLTMELIKFGIKQTKQDPGSFPKDIPSQSVS